jgi:carboxylesterase type B
VEKYIHLFGGDAGSVTAIGESAGANGILYQITASDGVTARKQTDSNILTHLLTSFPFLAINQAIFQSPVSACRFGK